ncbi:MAG TPA: hypothetical protein VFK79_11635 [Xanthobacteraceae bacterium]|nr:hypothetical protein [Xanthobacteraceae bacterium]
MKTFVTTAAILAALTAPVFAQGLTAGSESRGEPQASGAKESAKDPNDKGQGAMGQGQILPRAGTTGAASEPKDPAKESAGSSANPGPKTGVTTGGGTGGGGSGSGSGGEGGSDK